MDLAICLIDREQRTIKFSGSRNGIYIIHDDGDITNFSGDSVPVGGVYSKRHNPLDREYEMHEMSWGGATVYLRNLVHFEKKTSKGYSINNTNLRKSGVYYTNTTLH